MLNPFPKTLIFSTLCAVGLAFPLRAAQTGHDWVMRVHDAHVPEVVRPSFLQRNAVNRDLLALAPRLG